MEVVVDITLAQLLKTTSRKKLARSGSYRFIAARNLHRLAGPIHLRVSTLTKKRKDTDAKVGGQRVAARVEGQRLEGQRSPESKLGGPRLWD